MTRKTIGKGKGNGGSRQSGVPGGPYKNSGIKGSQGAGMDKKISGGGRGKASNNV